MNISIMAFLITGIVIVNQGPRTVEQVLGKNQTQSILKAAAAESVAQMSDTYLVTDETIQTLREAGVSEGVLMQMTGVVFPSLKPRPIETLKLIGREIKGKEEFLKAVRSAIGDEETRRYKDVILISAQGYLLLDHDFENIVTSRVLTTQAPARNVKKWLAKNFRISLSNYVLFLRSKAKIRNRLTSHEEYVDEFLRIQAAKCGELPCAGVPPCCGEMCDPCPKSDLDDLRAKAACTPSTTPNNGMQRTRN